MFTNVYRIPKIQFMFSQMSKKHVQEETIRLTNRTQIKFHVLGDCIITREPICSRSCVLFCSAFKDVAMRATLTTFLAGFFYGFASYCHF